MVLSFWRSDASFMGSTVVWAVSQQIWRHLEDLGNIAVLMRKHAATNPNAWFYNQPITLDDHQNSRWIVKPWLRLLDCCQESDGGVAIIVRVWIKPKT